MGTITSVGMKGKMHFSIRVSDGTSTTETWGKLPSCSSLLLFLSLQCPFLLYLFLFVSSLLILHFVFVIVML